MSSDWTKELYGAIDSKDASKFASFLTENSAFTLGNSPSAKGKKNIEETIAEFFKSIKGIDHNITDTKSCDDTFLTRGTVKYTRHDDTQLEVPFCNVMKLDGEKIREFQIYVNNAEL